MKVCWNNWGFGESQAIDNIMEVDFNIFGVFNLAVPAIFVASLLLLVFLLLGLSWSCFGYLVLLENATHAPPPWPVWPSIAHPPYRKEQELLLNSYFLIAEKTFGSLTKMGVVTCP